MTTPIHSLLSSAHIDNNARFLVVHRQPEFFIVQTTAGLLLETLTDATQFGGFNLGLHVGDDPAQVLRHRAQLLHFLRSQYSLNQRSLSQSLGQSVKPLDGKSRIIAANNGATPKIDVLPSIHWLMQVHGNRVVTVEDVLSGIRPQSADAMVTGVVGLALAVMTADCVPIVLWHPQTGRVAAIHAGWQGLANGVIGSTVRALLATSNPADGASHQPASSTSSALSWQAWIGACIGQAHYEVSRTMLTQLMAGCEQQGMDGKLLQAQIVRSHEDSTKAWLNLPRLAALQIERLGGQLMPSVAEGNYPSEQVTGNSNLVRSHVSPALACSYADGRFYSHRRLTHQAQQLTKPSTGRMALVVVKCA